ncbi:DivIVA domain-containing protein [Aminomonas paucivorans]|uniref:DivIVA domain containing protein n=1 Tax=Aminomonas paucivorans DSM 12260 TaxID=584708 RepID=E3CWA6_9BACT|nr:DivIVA domain-containing protein [Aminomonas paucivorans]EFQ23358.1 DivIVA domain containing protein [Aminomonas paucivorans DSM 12260]
MSELLSPLDVVNQSFRKGFRGYEPGEVDEFLDQVAESLQGYIQKAKDLERSVQVAEDQLKEYRGLKESLQEALILAQRSAEERVRSATAQADAILAEAQAKSERLLQEAEGQVAEMRREMGRLRQVRSQYVAEFKALLLKFDSLLGHQAPAPIPEEDEPREISRDRAPQAVAALTVPEEEP